MRKQFKSQENSKLEENPEVKEETNSKNTENKLPDKFRDCITK